uniref:Uncharacterized protein n=1 Tax=Panagrolaimus superbus TaxID=310955 RepID=A0A914YIT8_9BILA
MIKANANQINWKISDNFIQFKNFICFFSSVCGFALVFDFVKDCQHVYKVLDRKKLNYGNSQLTIIILNLTLIFDVLS